MNLEEFIDSNSVNIEIYEPGLVYYVKKHALHPNLIILSNCRENESDNVRGAYFKFLKKYEHRIPFIAEQIFNLSLARLYERRGWSGKCDLANIPSYVSPLAMQMFTEYCVTFKYGSVEVPSLLLKEVLDTYS